MIQHLCRVLLQECVLALGRVLGMHAMTRVRFDKNVLEVGPGAVLAAFLSLPEVQPMHAA